MSKAKPKPQPAPAPGVYTLLPIGDVVPSPINPRTHFDDAALAELAGEIEVSYYGEYSAVLRAVTAMLGVDLEALEREARAELGLADDAPPQARGRGGAA